MSLAEAYKLISGLPETMRAEGMAILRRNAELMLGYAQIFCPVRTGALRDSGRIVETADSLTVKFGGATAPYAPIVEAKQPFLQPAIQIVAPYVQAELESFIAAKVKEVEIEANAILGAK